MRYVLVLVLLMSLITPARAQWARWREKARGRSPHKEPRRRIERGPRRAAPPPRRVQIPVVPATSALAVRGRAQLARELDRVSSSIRTILSPDRRHVAQVRSFPGGSVVFVDGRRVYPRTGHARIIGAPSWNPQGRSLALLEKVGRHLRLVVLPDVDLTAEVLSWRIPPERSSQTMPVVGTPVSDKVFWADNGRINIGRELLRPRAQVSFSVAMAEAAGAE